MQNTLKFSLILITILLTACAGSRPQHLGISENTLSPCPARPNCVNSFASDPTHAIAPIAVTSEESWQVLITTLEQWPHVQVVTQTPVYLHAEFTSAIMGFVDDVEFYFHHNRIHIRSASRLGYSDLGANRARIEALRDLLNGP